MTRPPIVETPSPNHDSRPPSVTAIDTLVLHYTGMTSAQAALDRLTDPGAKVSAHWLIDEDGTCVRLVPEARRAWHAGVSAWRGVPGVNDRSIGIELVNPGHEFGYRPFPRAQMDALRALAREILTRHPIEARNVVGHADVAPLRKEDPGELFDWAGLAAAGVGLCPVVAEVTGSSLDLRTGAEGAPVRAHQAHLGRYGYAITVDGTFGAETAAVVRAFQRHFRQSRVDGVIDAATSAALSALVAALAPA